MQLAVFSDDGCNVIINGQPAWSKKGTGQALPELSQSLHLVGDVLEADQTYQIKVEYSNTVYTGNLDVDGVTLFAFTAGAVPVSSMSVQRVSFSGNSTITEDAILNAQSLGAPHWDVARTPISVPVRYTTGSTPMANAAFNVSPSTSNKAVSIRGRSSWGYFPPKRCMPRAGKVSYPATSADFQIPNSVQNTSIGIEWEFSTNGGNTWNSAGTSSNHLYGTIQSSGQILTVVDVACRAGVGQSQPSSVFGGIWNYFKGLRVSNVKGEPLKYWGPGANELAWDGVPALVSLANGKCGQWADFFRQVNATQGIVVNRVKAVARPKLVAVPEGSTPVWCEPIGFRVSPTASGQNMSPPTENYFGDHVLTKYGSTIYDPSYGVQAYTQQSWEDEQIVSLTFRHPDTDEVRTVPKTTGTKELDYS